MRRLAFGWGVAFLLASCASQPPAVAPQAATESHGAGGVTSVALHGQIVVTHPPGRQDAIKEVQRVAAQRCPSGYLLRSVTTRPPPANELIDHFLEYEAVIDCGGSISGYGGPN